MSVLDINSQNYSEATSKEGTVIVKVSSPTCGPCKMMAGLFDKISNENEDESVSFCAFEVNSEEDKALARSLNISSVPAFLIYKDQQLKFQFVGAFPLNVLKSKLGL